MEIVNFIFPIIPIVKENAAKLCQSPTNRTTMYVYYEIEKISNEAKTALKCIRLHNAAEEFQYRKHFSKNIVFAG